MNCEYQDPFTQLAGSSVQTLNFLNDIFLLLLAIIYTLWKPEPKTVVSLFSAFLSWAGKPYAASGSGPWVQLRSFTMHEELWVLYNLMVTEFWLLCLVQRYSSCLLHKYMAHACTCVHWHIHTNTQFLCLENKSLKYTLRIFIFPSYEPLNLTSKPRVSKLEPLGQIWPAGYLYN